MLRKNILSIVFLLCSTSLFAERYPVDDVIDGMRFKAAHLEQLKVFLEKNLCTMTVNDNRVILGAGALRSEALVIGISPENPGNWNAYHQAPKAKFIHTVMQSKDPRILALKFLFDDQDNKVALQFKIAKPVLITAAQPPFYHYISSVYKLSLAEYGEQGIMKTLKTQQGDKIIAGCIPR